MRFEIGIATRYLFFIKKTSFVGILSWISLLGIVLGTTALVVVLSVFNGLMDYNKQFISHYNSALAISPVKGKFFEPNAQLLSSIKQQNGIAYATYTLTDNALLTLNAKKSIAKLTGIEKDFFKNENFKACLLDSNFSFYNKPFNLFLASSQLVNELEFVPETNFNPVEILYPNQNDLVGAAMPNSFASEMAFLEPIDVDNINENSPMAWIDLSQMRQLLNQPSKISSIQIGVNDENQVEKLKKTIAKLLPKTLQIKTNEEQHAELFRAINIEKLFMFVALLFIIAISSLNIYFSLSMLVIEKNQDIKTLLALGASNSHIHTIFQLVGLIISVLGIVIGLLLGFMLCYLQQTVGLVKMYGGSMEQFYPCLMHAKDFIYTGVSVFVIAFLISKIPAKKASKITTLLQ
jgi:lipoprotein-releasing system permease protein